MRPTPHTRSNWHELRQYAHKPHSTGIKLYVLCDTTYMSSHQRRDHGFKHRGKVRGPIVEKALSQQTPPPSLVPPKMRHTALCCCVVSCCVVLCCVELCCVVLCCVVLCCVVLCRVVLCCVVLCCVVLCCVVLCCVVVPLCFSERIVDLRSCEITLPTPTLRMGWIFFYTRHNHPKPIQIGKNVALVAHPCTHHTTNAICIMGKTK